MNTIKFRIAAKTDVGLVRTNNEDNFQASSDLSGGQMRWINNEICSLGEKGALIVVADGMGGMNAGEVASELAIETIRDYFNPIKLTSEVIKNRYSIEKYMNDAIIAADARIKEEAKVRPETKGMGTTIVIGWILGEKLYISWCGDSRAYVYNPSAGLHQITKDHSYVQNLVDKGSLTREEAFDFPDSNIITRCLSDGVAKAKPESLLKPYEICDNDIIMLCTDGLSGMIRDEEIESIIKANENNMDSLADELIKAACDADGSDNITICLCQILQGGNTCNPSVFIDYDKRLSGNKPNLIRTLINKPEEITPKNKHFWLIGLICVVVVIVSVVIGWIAFKKKPIESVNEEVQTENVQKEETTQEVSVVDQKATNDSSRRIEGSGNTKKIPEKREDETSVSIFQEIETTVPEEGLKAGKDETDLTPLPASDNQFQPVDDDLTKIETEEYTVKKGDTYSHLAIKYKTEIKILQELNNNKELKAGDIIIVPKYEQK